jgi:hypothetical protein
VSIRASTQVAQQVRELFSAAMTPRYVILVTDEDQTRIFKVREISLSEMIAILEANGLMPDGVADLRGADARPA